MAQRESNAQPSSSSTTKTDIHDLPERIESAMQGLHSAAQGCDELRAKMTEIEDTVTLAVLTTKAEGSDKPLYSNETARSIAKREQLAGHNHYQLLLDQLKTGEMVKAARAAHLEGLRASFRIALIDYEFEKLGPRDAGR